MRATEVSDADRVSFIRGSLAELDRPKAAPPKPRSIEEDAEAIRRRDAEMDAARRRPDLPLTRQARLRAAMLDALDNHFSPLMSHEHDELVAALRAMERAGLNEFSAHEAAILAKWPRLAIG